MASFNNHTSHRSRFTRFSALLQAGILALVGVAPLLIVNTASAEQLSARKVTITDSTVSATSEYDFQFSWSPATDVEGVIIEFCTTPLGTCAKPAGMNVSYGAVTLDAHTGFPNNTTAFTEVTADTNECNDVTANDNTVTMYCMSRTEATSATGTNATIDLSGVVNPTAITTVYIRIGLYDSATFAAPSNRIHEGTVAAAIVDQLTINGRVQERLNFCVAALDTAASMPATVAACSALTDQNVDLGIIDETAPVKTPVATVGGNGADDDYGILMLNTNATGGAVVGYYPVADAGGTNEVYSFRVDNATCTVIGSQPDETDQCFVDADNATTGTTLSAGNEGFGLTVTCIETPATTAALGSVPTWYAGTDTSVVDTGGTSSGDSDCQNTDVGLLVGWNESGVSDTIASSTSPVDDEIVKIAFAASAAITTPSGNYTTTTTYIATVTF